MSVLVSSHSSWMSSFPHYPESFVEKRRNDIELSRDMLISVLTYLSTLIPKEFGSTPVRLVCHGGAVMLLHRDLNRLAQQQAASNGGNINDIPLRTTTRDVDYICRSFVTEYTVLGFPDAGERLQRCIRATAAHFRIGTDWMNSDADVALPMAADPTTGKPYDPIYTASIQPNNIHVHTIFTSPNSLLTLIGVAPFWSIALKLVRYNSRDAGDIALLLQNGTSTRGVQWTTQLVEDWLLGTCWPMGYAAYPREKIAETRARISHAVNSLGPSATTSFVSSGPPVVPGQAWASNAMGEWTSDRAIALPQTWAPTSPPPIGWSGPMSQPLQQPSNHALISRSPVEAFDRSLNAFLGTQTYRPPNVNTNEHDAEYYDAKSRTPSSKKDQWSKYARGNEKKEKEKKAKKKDKSSSKVKARRAKWMLSWREPDDSDEYSDSDNYSDDSDGDGWGSGSMSDGWTLVSSQHSSQHSSPHNYGPYPPPPIQLDTPPLEYNNLIAGPAPLQRPKQYSTQVQRQYDGYRR